jgi:hypothetical protein
MEELSWWSESAVWGAGSVDWGDWAGVDVAKKRVVDKAIRIGSGLVGRGVLEDMFVRLTVSRCFGRAEDTLAENGKDLTQRARREEHRGRRELGAGRRMCTGLRSKRDFSLRRLRRNDVAGLGSVPRAWKLCCDPSASTRKRRASPVGMTA